MKITLPNSWRPRPYQRAAWSYLENGGLHAELIWHRRSGKDEICLHRTACAAFERVANYWHMLPLAVQVRKAIWEAVNPHTGKRRIDEAFPHELRATTREDQMLIKFVNGSSWQALGSDNFNAMVGSPPAGIVYSEWALANPSARAYLRPILAENKGWQVFITTPRGKNHAHTTFTAAQKTVGAFAQRLTALETGVFTPEALEAERQSYIGDYGADMGQALFEQEYLCSFDAAILGAFYGAEMKRAHEEGRITHVPYDPGLPVFTIQDIGFTDDTVILFFQVLRGEIRIIDCYDGAGHGVEHYAEVMKGKPYTYGAHWLPHDAQARTMVAAGRTVVEQYRDCGISPIHVLPNKQTEQQGILSVRKLFPNLWIDAGQEILIEAITQFQREWDDDRKCFKDAPKRDWTNHFADALRYLSWVWREPYKQPEKPENKIIQIGGKSTMTMNDLIKTVAKRRERH